MGGACSLRGRRWRNALLFLKNRREETWTRMGVTHYVKVDHDDIVQEGVDWS